MGLCCFILGASSAAGWLRTREWRSEGAAGSLWQEKQPSPVRAGWAEGFAGSDWKGKEAGRTWTAGSHWTCEPASQSGRLFLCPLAHWLTWAFSVDHWHCLSIATTSQTHLASLQRENGAKELSHSGDVPPDCKLAGTDDSSNALNSFQKKHWWKIKRVNFFHSSLE